MRISSRWVSERIKEVLNDKELDIQDKLKLINSYVDDEVDNVYQEGYRDGRREAEAEFDGFQS